MLEKPPSLLNMLSMRSILFCVVFIFTISSCVGKSGFSGMKCEGNRRKFMVSILDDTMMSCPPLFGDKDDKYCCTRDDGRSYCCDESEYLREYGMGFVVPVLVSVLVALTMVCCVCCLCCPCCLWYKRRNRGTVYNNVPPAMTMQPAVPQHGPHSEMYQQQPPLPYPVMQMPQPQMDQGPYPPVPPHGVPMHQQYPPSPYPPAVPPHAQHPPTYNEAIGTQQPQMYSRQAPYNPNF